MSKLRVVRGSFIEDISNTLPNQLRRIADELEAGDYGDIEEATVVFPGASEIFHFGGLNRDAGTSALLNCTCAITKIANRVIE